MFKDCVIAMHDVIGLRYSADWNSLELATTSPTGPRWPRDDYHDLDGDCEFNNDGVEVDDSVPQNLLDA